MYSKPGSGWLWMQKVVGTQASICAASDKRAGTEVFYTELLREQSNLTQLFHSVDRMFC
jgi:hypothetical protein